MNAFFGDEELPHDFFEFNNLASNSMLESSNSLVEATSTEVSRSSTCGNGL